MTRQRRPPLPPLPPHPPLHELPWMRIECQGETGQWLVFCMAVHDGRIVGGAPIGKNMIGMNARAAWRLWAHRKAKLMRIDPPPRPDP